MSKSSWFAGGVRPQDVPVPDPVRVGHARKDTKHWCRGKVGRPHQPELVENHSLVGQPWEWNCGWVAMRIYGRTVEQWRWRCKHAIRCSVCGKYLVNDIPKEECPLWQG